VEYVVPGEVLENVKQGWKQLGLGECCVDGRILELKESEHEFEHVKVVRAESPIFGSVSARVSARALVYVFLGETHKSLDIVDDELGQRIGAFLKFRLEIGLLDFVIIVVLLAFLAHEVDDPAGEPEDRG
jgi:hypothetical protein